MAAITGMGAVSALGIGVSHLWDAMSAGRDGIAPIRRFDSQVLGVTLGALVPERNSSDYDAATGSNLCIELAILAAREAWLQARQPLKGSHRLALVFGSSLGESDCRVHQITEAVSDALGVLGPRLTVSTACASSTNAIGMGLDLLSMNAADAVIAGGADVLTPLVLAGFKALGVLAEGKCAPFGEPAGTTLGEGAGFVVLERETSESTGPSVLGYGLSADAYHDTGPDLSGAGVARSMQSALSHAGLSPAAIDYVNAHGTGTRANDPAEWRAIQRVFGDRADRLPVSSSKSFLGHAQGAAGVLESMATIVAMQHGCIPPTQRLKTSRPKTPSDPVGQDTPREAKCLTAMCTNSAFGGANCAIVVGDKNELPARARRPISLAGCGAVGPQGFTLDALRDARQVSGRVAPLHLEKLAPRVDPRGLDPSTRYLVAATSLCLVDAGLNLSKLQGDRAGLILGTTEVSPLSDAMLDQTIDEHGYQGLSAKLFSRQVLNAPAGSTARLLGLRGLHSTVSAGSATGLLAFVYAAELLASREDCDHIVAAGLDELAGDVQQESGRSEGAACGLLRAGAGEVMVAGWSVAGPGRMLEAARAALSCAGLRSVDLVIGSLPEGTNLASKVIDPRELVGESPAFTPSAAVLIAAQKIRRHELNTVLVTQSSLDSADCALVLVGQQHGEADAN